MDNRVSIDHGDPPVIFQNGDVRMFVMEFPLRNRKLLVIRHIGGMEHAIDRHKIGLDRGKRFALLYLLDSHDGVSQSASFSNNEFLETDIPLAIRDLFTKRTKWVEHEGKDPGLRHIPF